MSTTNEQPNHNPRGIHRYTVRGPWHTGNTSRRAPGVTLANAPGPSGSSSRGHPPKTAPCAPLGAVSCLKDKCTPAYFHWATSSQQPSGTNRKTKGRLNFPPLKIAYNFFVRPVLPSPHVDPSDPRLRARRPNAMRHPPCPSCKNQEPMSEPHRPSS